MSPGEMASGRDDVETADREGVGRSKSPWVRFAEEHLPWGEQRGDRWARGSRRGSRGQRQQARQFVSQANPLSADIYSIFYQEIGRGERWQCQFAATPVNIFLPLAHMGPPGSQLRLSF